MTNFKNTIRSLFRKEKVTGSAVTALLIGAIIALNVIVYALTVGFGLYYTPTDELDMSITDSSDEKFAAFEGQKVDVVFCRDSASFDDETGTMDHVYFFHKTAKEFEKRYPNLINLRYVNIITKRDENGKIFERLVDYQKNDKGEIEYPLYDTSVIFDCVANNKHRVVTNVEGAAFYVNPNSDASDYQAYIGEEVFSSMVSWVLSKTTQKAYFTTYHGESAEIYFTSMLACAGYEIDVLDLRKQNIPDDADLLIISNPTKDFEKSVQGGPTSEINRLEDYLKNGGNLYVSFDPYVDKLNNLEKILKDYGISFIETDIDGEIYKNIVRDSSNSTTADSFTLISSFADSEYANEISDTIGKFDSGKVRLRECAALKVEGGARALLTSSSSAATYANGERTDKSGSYCIGATARTGDEYSEKYGNVFVISSVYLTANDLLVTKGCANRDFIYAVLDTVFDANNAPYGCKPIHYNDGSLENLTMGTARIYTIIILAIPAAIAVVGIVIIRRRKNR